MSVLIDDMFETMYAAPGRGLAAPQLGVMQRIFVMDELWKTGTPTPMVFINPEITAVSNELITNQEGCLSIPGVLLDIARPLEVTLGWTDLDGAVRSQTFGGFAAACVQHELDHLNGKTTFDRLSPAMRSEKLAEYAS